MTHLSQSVDQLAVAVDAVCRYRTPSRHSLHSIHPNPVSTSPCFYQCSTSPNFVAPASLSSTMSATINNTNPTRSLLQHRIVWYRCPSSDTTEPTAHASPQCLVPVSFQRYYCANSTRTNSIVWYRCPSSDTTEPTAHAIQHGLVPVSF